MGSCCSGGNLRLVSYRKRKSFQTLELKPQKDEGDELGDGNQLLQQSLSFRVTEGFIGRRGTRTRNGLISWAGGASYL